MHLDNRRSFVKKSLATSVSISFAGLIRAHGEEGGSTTTNTTVAETTWDPNQTTIATTYGVATTWDPNQTTVVTTEEYNTTTFDPDQTTMEPTTETSISTKLFTQYRLICVQAPNVRTGQIAWLEAATMVDIPTAQSHAVKVEAEGPSREDTTFGMLRIKASWTSTLTGFVQKSVEKRLELEDSLYDGRWIVEGDTEPTVKIEKFVDSPQDLPLTMPTLAFSVADDQVDASVVRAGYYISGFNVTGGNNFQNSTTYATSDGTTAATEHGAELALAAPDVSSGATVTPKSISAKTDIKNKSGFNIYTGGSSSRTKEYQTTTSTDGVVTYTFNGTCSSSLNATIGLDWKIIKQTRTKRVVYINGEQDHDEDDSTTDWSPELPAETAN